MPNAEQPFRLNWASFSTGEKIASENGPDLSIFVGDLAPDVSDAVLLETFAGRYPSVKGAKVVIDSNTGRSKGYGFVRFGDENERSRAMTKMNGAFCSSRQMRVGIATHKRAAAYGQQNGSIQALTLAGGHGGNGSMANGSLSDGESNNSTIFLPISYLFRKLLVHGGIYHFPANATPAVFFHDYESKIATLPYNPFDFFLGSCKYDLSEGSNCKWCSLALDIEDWVYSQLENNSHLLHGVTRLIRRKRTATIKFLKKDLADLVSNALDANTYSRGRGLLDELRHLWNLDFVEQTCDFVYKQLSTMQKMGDLKGALHLLEFPRFLSVGELNFECSLI